MSFLGLFAINGNAVVVASGARLDFEEQSEHVIVIESTDNGTFPLSVQVSLKAGSHTVRRTNVT